MSTKILFYNFSIIDIIYKISKIYKYNYLTTIGSLMKYIKLINKSLDCTNHYIFHIVLSDACWVMRLCFRSLPLANAFVYVYKKSNKLKKLKLFIE